MNRVRTGLCMALVACLGLVASATAADSAKPAKSQAGQTAKALQGELIDTYCYSAGGAKGEGHAKCAAKCMRSGIPAGVLVDGQAWILATNPTVLAQYAAKTIRVIGKRNAKTHVILPKTIEVQENGQWKPVKLSDAHHE